MATATNDKPLRLGDLPVVKTNILENAREFDKGVVGGYNGIFPLTAASQGGIYLLPSTGKFYVCETDYNGAQISAPNSNFVELSVWKNHDRLSNLNEVWTSEDKKTGYIKYSNGYLEQWGFISLEGRTIPQGYFNIEFFLPFVSTVSHNLNIYVEDTTVESMSFSSLDTIRIYFSKDTFFKYHYHGLYWSARGMWK